MNITCWVSYVNKSKGDIHLAFDLNDNDYEKLLNRTKNLERKRLTKKGFVIKADGAICNELDNLVGKKLVISVVVEHYKFMPKNSSTYIEGYTFRYNGLKKVNDIKV